MKPCKKNEELISEMLFGEVPSNEQEWLHDHMADCDGCMNFYLSLYETLEAGEGGDFFLTDEQKEKIFSHAEEMDEQKKPIKFNWTFIASVAASLAVSGVIIGLSSGSFKEMRPMSNVDSAADYKSEEYRPQAKKSESKSEYGYKGKWDSEGAAKEEETLNTVVYDGLKRMEVPKVILTEAMEAPANEPGAVLPDTNTFYIAGEKAKKEPAKEEEKNLFGGAGGVIPETTGQQGLKDDKSKDLGKLFNQNEEIEDDSENASPVDNIGGRTRSGVGRSKNNSRYKDGNVAADEILDDQFADEDFTAEERKERDLRKRAENLKEEMARLKELEDNQKSGNQIALDQEESNKKLSEEQKIFEKDLGDSGKENKEVLKSQVEFEVDEYLKQAESLQKGGKKDEALAFAEKALEELSVIDGNDRALEEKRAKAQEIYNGLTEVAKSERPMLSALAQPMSTFSIDVDTASYQMAKHVINSGGRPDPMSIRAEEFINSFDYKYEAPKKEAFKVQSEVAVSPFHRGNHIMKIGVQGKKPGGAFRQSSHFCFIVDTSGSMADQNRLPLVKRVLPMIVKQMSAGDKVSLFSCGLNARLELDKVDVKNIDQIIERINTLNAVGATNLEASLLEGYKHTIKNLQKGSYSRVVLFSDGVANLGEKNANNILNTLGFAREKGIGITVVGMGEEEYNDNFLETLADKGDGNYVYIGGSKEAQKTFEKNFAATFHTIAYNVKIQVEFDPQQVAKYRLLGYENRRLKNRDFRDDKVDAGEVGSGQSVTAIYELELTNKTHTRPLAEVRLRYRDAVDNRMKEFSTPVLQKSYNTDFEKCSSATRLAFISGKFAEVLKDGGSSEGITSDSLLKYLRPLSSEMKDQDVFELLRLIEKSR